MFTNTPLATNRFSTANCLVRWHPFAKLLPCKLLSASHTLIWTSSTLNVKPRVTSSVLFRQCARPNFNPDTTDWHQRPVVRSDQPPVTDTNQVLSSPRKKASHKMLQLHQQLNKIVEMLAIQQKRVLLLNLKSLFSMVTVSSMNPFKQLSGSMFREKSTPHEKATRIQRYNRVFSNLVFFHLWKQHFMVQNICQNGAKETLDSKVIIIIVIV